MRLCQYKNILGRWPVTKSLSLFFTTLEPVVRVRSCACISFPPLCFWEWRSHAAHTVRCLSVNHTSELFSTTEIQSGLDNTWPEPRFSSLWAEGWGITWTACLGKLHSDWWGRSTWAQGSYHFLFCWKAAVKTSSRLKEWQWMKVCWMEMMKEKLVCAQACWASDPPVNCSGKLRVLPF